MALKIDLGGNDIYCSSVVTGVAGPDGTGTAATVASATIVQAGTDATAGTVKIFPTTTTTGTTTITAASNSGNTINNITTASQGGARTYTVPDAGASASFVMTAGNQTVGGTKTFSANPVLAAGTTVKTNAGTATLSSNAATVTTYATVITTESLTTAAGSVQAFTITLTGVAAGDLAFVQEAGGSNTRVNHNYLAVCTTNTITVTVRNTEPTNALNGTLIFNLLVLKA